MNIPRQLTRQGLKDKARNIEPVVRIGKSGLTGSVIEEIEKQLKKRKLIKIKLLKSFAERKDRKELAGEIAEKTEAELVSHVGFTVVLYKPMQE